MFSVAVPSNSVSIDVIEGSAGGPRGLCHRAVV
jgi:hypothetical protein